LYTLKNKEVVMTMQSLYAVLYCEGLEPYIEQDPDDYDDVLIKPSTPPEIRKKIEKISKEFEKGIDDMQKKGWI
jgi:hypothetical protein